MSAILTAYHGYVAPLLKYGVMFWGNSIGDPQDEHDHLVHHNSTDVLKFNGWKEEYVVERTPTGRCIRVRGGDSGWRKVETLLARVVHPQLGYGADLPREKLHAYTAYLYIEKKQIVGCLVVEPKMKAYKFIPGDPDCCSVEEYPVKCGVSRIWTHMQYRRRGLARALLDCARASFLHGAALQPQQLAFSAPTAAGKGLAAKYCGTDNFYVYLD
ncbi:N-acetyltransferase ESCO2 [Ostrinia furnacalis]|uniref:N-acetyltransferase ESCO2 n=1 Tax=Ostrinia furnacalis TaxID=93504 RepID=UPI00103B1B7C|nr:N-acetyltransferase ESCO2 [Ostrinia furnacalis]